MWGCDQVEWLAQHETGGRSQLAASVAVGEADLPSAGAEGGHHVAYRQKVGDEIVPVLGRSHVEQERWLVHVE